MMSPAENKRAKRRKNKKIRSDPRNGNGAEAHPNIPLDCLGSKLENRTLEEVGLLQPAELNHGNYLEMRCLVCNSEPPEHAHLLQLRRGLADGCEEGNEHPQGPLKTAPQLPWYICPNCKTSNDSSIPANGFGEYLPLSFVTETEEVGDSEICSCKSCFDQTYFSEISKKSVNAAPCSLSLDTSTIVNSLPHLPRHLERENSTDEELKLGWQDLKLIVHQIYREAGLTLGEALTPHLPPQNQGSFALPSDHRIKDIVCSLCRQDAHKLYLCLEAQVKMFVVEMRLRLLMQVGGALNGGNTGANLNTKPFVCLMLEEYAKLCLAAAQVAPYLEELEASHLKGFKLTWELVNRHLFQSIVYDDPLLHSRLTINLSQHRVSNGSGSVGRDNCHHDSFSAVTKFDDEMTVLSVLWREAEQLIESYNQGQAARAKQGLELLHAQMKQLMEEELNLSLLHRFPVVECQKSCAHTSGLKGHCPKGSSSPNFLSPSELVSLAEQADGHIMPPVSSTLHSGGKESGCSPPGGSWPSVCMKSSSFYAPKRFFTDILDSYQNNGLDCLTSEMNERMSQGQSSSSSSCSSPPPPPLPPPPALHQPATGEVATGCCRLQQNGVLTSRDLTKTQTSPIKHTSDLGANHQQLLQTSASFKGGGTGASSEVPNENCNLSTHPSTVTNNSGPESKGGCECHSCNQQQHEHTLDSHLVYESGSKQLRDLSPSLLTGLKSMFAEACGSPSALAAVKQLIHPHLYKVHNNNNNGSTGASQRNSKASLTVPSQQNSSFFPEPFDLKLEMQGILREQIKLATMGDWDYDVEEARSLFLHHYQNSVKPHRTMTSAVAPTSHFDLPAPQLPPLPPPLPTNKFFPPVSLEEVANSHTVLRNSMPTPPGMCQACKIESDSVPPRVGESATNINVINNLGHVGRKPVCHHGKALAPRELNGLIPEGYGTVDCAPGNSRHSQNSNLPATPPNSSMFSSSSSTPPNSVNGGSVGSGLSACSANGGSSSSSLSSMGTGERGIGGHGCCEGHIPDGGEESGPDDSCSERSSSTSTSNQRESRVCDCCYCEVFGHGVPVVAPVSRNYPEMRDRLRLRLSKRKAEGTGTVIMNNDKNEPTEDSRALEELLKFINGTEEDKNKQRKGKRKGPKRGEMANSNETPFHPEELRTEVTSREGRSLPDLLEGLHQGVLITCSKGPNQEELQAKQNPPLLQSPELSGNHEKQKAKITLIESPGFCTNHVSDLKVNRQPQQQQQTPRTTAKHQQQNLLQEPNNKTSEKTIKGVSLTGKQKQPLCVEEDQEQRLGSSSISKKHIYQSEKMNGNPSILEVAMHQLPQEKTKTKASNFCSHKIEGVSQTVPACDARVETLPESLKLNRNQTISNHNASATQGGHHHMNGSLTAKEIITASTCNDTKSVTRSKKNKKKKNGADDGTSPDDVFMPKDIDLENGELDEFEKELEAFKRFCFNSVPLANKEKVHVNLKDIVVKKKTNSNGMALSNGHKF